MVLGEEVTCIQMNTINVTLHCARCFSGDVKTDGKTIACQEIDCRYRESRERFIQMVAEMCPVKPVNVNVTVKPGQKAEEEEL